METTGVTYSELMQTTSIIGIVDRIQTPLSAFQKFLGHMSGDNTTATEQALGRVIGWDIFDSTRRFAGARAPDNGPRRVQKRRIGHQTAQLMHSHESIMIYDNKVFNSRGMGNNFGRVVDPRGMQYIASQIRYMTDRYRNQREWMFSRMLRGGFNMLPDGDNYSLREYDPNPTDGSFAINYQIPNSNKGRLQLGDPTPAAPNVATDILTDWSNPNADIIGQLLALNKAFVRLHGRALKHVFINSTTYNYLLNNLGLRAVGGDAFTVFQYLSQSMEMSRNGIRDAARTVIFRALPLIMFHVYDGVLSSDGEQDGTSFEATDLLIENDHAIFLPDPDNEWQGLGQGSELVLPNTHEACYEQYGFGSWATRVIDPPGFELKFIDNYLPLVYIPTCIAYGFVGT